MMTQLAANIETEKYGGVAPIPCPKDGKSLANSCRKVLKDNTLQKGR